MSKRTKNCNGWILLSSPDDGEKLLTEDLQFNQTFWTINRKAAVGDYAFFYITAPVKQIKVFGRICSRPKLQDEINEPWLGKHIVEVRGLKELKKNLTLSMIKYLFPEWRYWLQPRSSVKVPDEILPVLLQAVHNPQQVFKQK